MKHLFLYMGAAAIAFFAFCANQPSDVSAEVARETLVNADPDTLTNQDTVTVSFGIFNAPRSYALQVNADSLSGATAATCQLRLSTDNLGVDWVNLGSGVTVDGVTTRTLATGTFARGMVQCRCISPSGTQSTAVRIDFAASTD